MKKRIARFLRDVGSIWYLCFIVVTIMFLYCVVIYGFDINISKEDRRKAITSMFLNASSSEKYFAIDDKYGFLVDTEENDPKYAVSYFSSYEMAEFPYCFTCGFYASRGKDHIAVMRPFYKNGIYYSIEPQWCGDACDAEEAYPIFNSKNEDFHWSNDLSELGPDATDEKYRVKKGTIMSKYNSISFMGDDDLDCYSSFKSIYATYVLLIVWAMIALLIKRLRRRRNRSTQ